jgi:hypothetical protein
MTTVFSGINCSIAATGGDISKATATCVEIADFLSAARAAGRVATQQAATAATRSTANIQRFI